jgi:phosphohistidine phosphatase
VKRLTLMRHGNAQWKDPQISDFDRALNRRGNSEAEAMSRRLAELGLVPAMLLTSSARRAQQTADIVARELHVPSRRVHRDESLYLAGAEEILAAVRALGPRIPHVMIVGHNPGITEVAQRLAPESHLYNLATAAVCSLTFNSRTWAGVAPENVREVLNESPPTGLFALWAS